MSGAAAAVAAPDAGAGRCNGTRTRQYPTQVLLAEDQHPVGDLGADGQHEAFGEAVRSRTPRRDLDYLDARVRQDRVERRRELTGAVADEEPEQGGTFAEIHDEVTGLLCRPGPIGMPGHAQHVQVALATPRVGRRPGSSVVNSREARGKGRCSFPGPLDRAGDGEDEGVARTQGVGRAGGHGEGSGW